MLKETATATASLAMPIITPWVLLDVPKGRWRSAEWSNDFQLLDGRQ